MRCQEMRWSYQDKGVKVSDLNLVLSTGYLELITSIVD